VVATGIVNMWANEPAAIAASYRRIADRHPGRFLLDVGIGHPESTGRYERPYDTMVSYLDASAAVVFRPRAGFWPRWGPGRFGSRRTGRGTHPYLVVPEHTRRAREVLGRGSLLAPEHAVVLDADRERARRIGRDFLSGLYLQRSNTSPTVSGLGVSLSVFLADLVLDAAVDSWRGSGLHGCAGFEGRWRRPPPSSVMLSERPPPWPNLGEGTNLRKIVVRRAEPREAPTCARSLCAGPNLGEGTNLRKIVVRRAEPREGTNLRKIVVRRAEPRAGHHKDGTCCDLRKRHVE